MSQFSYKPFYRRNLPHIQPEGATFFVTFRLAGSLPVEIVEKLRAEREQADQRLAQITDQSERERQADLASRRWFGKWDEFLDQACTGVRHLANQQIAGMLADSLRYWDGKRYALEAFCIMPTHVHVVFNPLKNADGQFYSLATILHSLSSRS
jgi:hypothetical protein